MIPFNLGMALLVGAAAPTTTVDDVGIAALMDPGELTVGEEHSFTVSLFLGEGVSSTKAGIPAAFLQLEVPEGVKLGGKYVTGYRALSRNEFVLEPYERLMKEDSATVTFTLESAPEPGATIGVNVTGYLHSKVGEESRVTFLRRRVELPLVKDGVSKDADPARSNWGPDGDLLQIGDRAPGFEALRPDGSTYDLASVLGEKRVIVTTYRAHW